MAYKKQFESILKDLHKRRTRWLTEELFAKKPGAPHKLNRKILNKKINELQKITSNAFAKTIAKDEFNRCVGSKKTWHIKGHGIMQKKRNFQAWCTQHIPEGSKDFVYIFWGENNRCIYVGKTNVGVSRPLNHFEKHWIFKAKRVDIYFCSIIYIPKLECLAIHHFQPLHNKMKAATKDRTVKCTLCNLHKMIEKELNSIYAS